MCVQKLFRSPDQTTCRRTRLNALAIGGEYGTKQRYHPFLNEQGVALAAYQVMVKPCPKVLQAQVQSPAPTSKQGMSLQASVRVSQLAEEFQIGSDDQFGIAAGDWLAQVEALTPRYEQHLVGVRDDVVVCNVPDKESAVRKTDLKISGEAFRRPSQMHARTAQVLDDPDRGFQ